VSTGTAWGTSITDNSSNWNTAYSLRITSATSPLSITSNVLSISQASGSTNGYLSSTDWTTFNNKQNALTNPLTGTGTSGYVTYFNGTSTVTGSANHYWDSTNNRLGIGTTNPQRSITIYNATADNHLQIAGSAPSVSLTDAVTGATYQAKFALATAANQFYSGVSAGDFITISQGGASIWGTGVGEKMRLTYSGYLGIGTNNPSDLLQVGGASGPQTTPTAIRLDDTYRTGGDAFNKLKFYLYKGSTETYGFGLGDLSDIQYWAGSSSTGVHRFFTSQTERMRITSAGNVGIGTSSPTSPLHVGTSTSGNQKIQHWGEPGFVDNYGLILRGSSLDGVFKFYGLNNGTETTNPILSMNRSSGNVGIGTSSPLQTTTDRTVLTVNGTTTSLINLAVGGTLAAYWYGTSSNTQLWSQNRLDFNTASANDITFNPNNTERMRITSGGNVCIGKTSYDNSTTGITLAGLTDGSIGSFVTDGAACMLWNRKTSTGDLVIIRYNSSGIGSISTNGSSVSYNTTSDYRLKQDFKDYKGLDLVSAIKTYDYQWKSDNSRMYGVIAHELQEIIPYAVNGEKDAKEMQGVDYSKIVPVLIKAIQEQQAQIEELKAKIK
jgi:hypothetical protein